MRRHLDSAPNWQFSLRAIMFVTLGIAVFISWSKWSIHYYRNVRPGLPIPRRVLRQIQPGMSKWRVRAILGSPTHVAGPRKWEYWRRGKTGWIEVLFDKKGRVMGVYDQSVPYNMPP